MIRRGYLPYEPFCLRLLGGSVSARIKGCYKKNGKERFFYAGMQFHFLYRSAIPMAVVILLISCAFHSIKHKRTANITLTVLFMYALPYLKRLLFYNPFRFQPIVHRAALLSTPLLVKLIGLLPYHVGKLALGRSSK